MPVEAITVDTLRTARYAQSQAASIQQCWSTWNVLCTFHYTAELIPANPMPMVGRRLRCAATGRCGWRVIVTWREQV